MSAGRSSVSSVKDYCTPPEYVEAARTALGGRIDLDPCSNSAAIVGALLSWSPPADGLAASWDARTIYVNPPYGRDQASRTTIADWLRKCADAWRRGSSVVALVPVATNTRHWHESVFPAAAAICFLREPRVKFFLPGGPREGGKGAPMACAAVYWGQATKRFRRAFAPLGFVVDL